MGDLKTGNTSYPTAKDTATLFADLTDFIVAQNQNGPNTAIVAIENELGVGLKGTVADLATRLAVNVGTDGGIVKATADPASPGTPAFYYNTVTNKLKIFNISTGQWEEFTTAAGLASYVRTDIPNTITAVHTFGTTTDTTSPFLVASATSAVVTNLNADKVDGQHAVLTIGADHTHTATGAMGGIISHTSLTNIGSNTHAQIDTFISSKAAASGLASLDGSSKVVQTANFADVAGLGNFASLLTLSTETFTSNTSNNLALSLGSVQTGERYLVFVSAYVVASGTMSMVYSSIWQSAGTASGSFDGGIGTPIMAMSQTASNKYEGSSSMIFRVTAGGTATLSIVTNQTGGTSPSYGSSMYAVRIK